MRVLIGGEREMAERFGGVAGLLQRAKHQVGKDALFGLSGDFRSEALVMLRTNGYVSGGKRDMHGAHAAAAFASGGADTAVANGDAALGEIFDAKGITERAG